MKQLNLSIIFALLILCIFSSSCKKDDESSEIPIRIKKITNWNPNTDVEVTVMEITYDNAGKVLKFMQDDNNYSVVYNSDGKISNFIGKDKNGYAVNYRFEYNSNGSLAKFVKTNDNPAAVRVKELTKTFTYNIDNSINTTITYPSPLLPYTTNSTWNVGNMQSFITSEPYFNETEFKYDDKNNPYALIELIYIATLGYPIPTKNNPLEYKLYNGTSTTLLKKTYSYNQHGYPTSMKVEGDINGRKFYYD